MKTLVDLLTPERGTPTYVIASVTPVQSSAGTVTLSLGAGRTAVGVPYLLSYTPTVNDKVQVLASETVGMLVLGKTALTTAPAAPTVRTATIVPNRSMTWSHTVKSTEGTVTEGDVAQGSDGVTVYSGAYVYPAGAVTLVTGELITKAELLVYRVDTPQMPWASSPVIHELTGFTAAGEPVLDPLRSFMPTDIRPGVASWGPIPVAWAEDIVARTTVIGLGFAPTSAQLAFTYARYGSYTTPAIAATTAGTLRLTIEK